MKIAKKIYADEAMTIRLIDPENIISPDALTVVRESCKYLCEARQIEGHLFVTIVDAPILLRAGGTVTCLYNSGISHLAICGAEPEEGSKASFLRELCIDTLFQVKCFEQDEAGELEEPWASESAEHAALEFFDDLEKTLGHLWS